MKGLDKWVTRNADEYIQAFVDLKLLKPGATYTDLANRCDGLIEKIPLMIDRLMQNVPFAIFMKIHVDFAYGPQTDNAVADRIKDHCDSIPEEVLYKDPSSIDDPMVARVCAIFDGVIPIMLKEPISIRFDRTKKQNPLIVEDQFQAIDKEKQSLKEFWAEAEIINLKGD